jgi:hypothetical protein
MPLVSGSVAGIEFENAAVPAIGITHNLQAEEKK